MERLSLWHLCWGIHTTTAISTLRQRGLWKAQQRQYPCLTRLPTDQWSLCSERKKDFHSPSTSKCGQGRYPMAIGRRRTSSTKAVPILPSSATASSATAALPTNYRGYHSNPPSPHPKRRPSTSASTTANAATTAWGYHSTPSSPYHKLRPRLPSLTPTTLTLPSHSRLRDQATGHCRGFFEEHNSACSESRSTSRLPACSFSRLLARPSARLHSWCGGNGGYRPRVGVWSIWTVHSWCSCPGIWLWGFIFLSLLLEILLAWSDLRPLQQRKE